MKTLLRRGTIPTLGTGRMHRGSYSALAIEGALVLQAVFHLSFVGNPRVPLLSNRADGVLFAGSRLQHTPEATVKAAVNCALAPPERRAFRGEAEEIDEAAKHLIAQASGAVDVPGGLAADDLGVDPSPHFSQLCAVLWHP